MLDLVGHMQTEREQLSRSERLIADIVLSDIDSALSASIVDLAARAEVSPPTVTRFCRRLGCQSFSEFKVRLAKSRFVGQRYLTPPDGPHDTQLIARNIVNSAQSALYEFYDRLDLAAIERAAAMVAEAEFVLAFGSGGTSSMVAIELQNRLFRLGIRVAASVDHQEQMMRTAAATRGTVIVGSSVSGRNQQLASSLAIAGEYEIGRIVLTRPHSLVAQESDVLLPIDLPEQADVLRPSSSRYAFLAMIDVLAQSVATRITASAVATMRRIKHQLIVNRDGDDTQALGD